VDRRGAHLRTRPERGRDPRTVPPVSPIRHRRFWPGRKVLGTRTKRCCTKKPRPVCSTWLVFRVAMIDRTRRTRTATTWNRFHLAPANPLNGVPAIARSGSACSGSACSGSADDTIPAGTPERLDSVAAVPSGGRQSANGLGSPSKLAAWNVHQLGALWVSLGGFLTGQDVACYANTVHWREFCSFPARTRPRPRARQRHGRRSELLRPESFLRRFRTRRAQRLTSLP